MKLSMTHAYNRWRGSIPS